MTAAVKMSEADLQRTVLEIAALTGWMTFHPRRAMQGDRHLTAVAGQGVGYPDLTLVHPTHGVLWVELKSARGRLSPAQQLWRDRIEAAGGRWLLWRPEDLRLGLVQAVLQGGSIDRSTT